MAEKTLHDLVTTFTRSLRQRPEPVPLSLAADLMQFVSELHDFIGREGSAEQGEPETFEGKLADVNRRINGLVTVPLGAVPALVDRPPASDRQWPGLEAAVREAVRKSGDTFSTSDIYRYVAGQWPASFSAGQRAPMTMEIGRLCARGEVERVSEARGRTPAVYRRAAVASEID